MTIYLDAATLRKRVRNKDGNSANNTNKLDTTPTLCNTLRKFIQPKTITTITLCYFQRTDNRTFLDEFLHHTEFHYLVRFPHRVLADTYSFPRYFSLFSHCIN